MKLGFETVLAYGSAHQLALISVFDVLESGGRTWLYAGSAATGTTTAFRLEDGETAVRLDDTVLNGQGQTYAISDMVIISYGQENRIVSTSNSGARLDVETLGAAGWFVDTDALSLSYLTAQISRITSFGILDRQFIATASHMGDGIKIWELSENWTITERSQQLDTEKSTAKDVIDLLPVTVNDRTFLVSASVSDNGLSTYGVANNGVSWLVDTLGTKEGLWVSGLDSIVSVTSGGQTYVITGSTLSQSLTSVRVNDLGVLFIEDHVIDSLFTRFANVDALASFEVGERGFVLAGGSDDGISLLEVMPDGTLFHHHALANQNSWTIENVTAIGTTRVGDDQQIFVAGAGAEGITQLTLNRSDIGEHILGTDGKDTLFGTAKDDVLFGYGGTDILEGGAGDDILIAGAGEDRLTGGTGADVFVFSRDGERKTITDFEHGKDVIHIDGWGMVYDISDLYIREKNYGVDIYWQDEHLRVQSVDGQPIDPDSWSNFDFVF